MNDLISRSELIKQFPQNMENPLWHFTGIRAAIEAAPAIDAVPVVRCKDCERRCTYKCPMYHTETCFDDLDGFDDYNVDKTDDNGFCHKGKRNGR